MRRFASLTLVLLVSACAVEQEPTVTPPPPTSTTTTVTTTTIPGQTTTTTIPAPEAACPEGDVMLADGRLLEFQPPDADGTRIAGISWATVGNCHTVTLDFATEDGAPATTPPSMDVRLMRNLGVLRIDTAATESVVVDQLVEQGSVERLFVPVEQLPAPEEDEEEEEEQPEAERFVDLVLSGPAVARARVLTSPARLEVELQPGGPEVGRPLISPQVVVVEPGSAAVAAPVLDISGYTTGDIESLELAVLDGQQVVTEETLELEPSPDLWRAFEHALQVGEPYDALQVTTADDSVIAAIPLNPEVPEATQP